MTSISMSRRLCITARRGAGLVNLGCTLSQGYQSDCNQQPQWLAPAEQLSCFPTTRCVQMQPADWQELSAILANITKQCAASKQRVNSSVAPPGSGCPTFASTLELLGRLGQVTSCLLCVNGDDKAFSIARVAQAIRTTTRVLEAAIAQAVPAGLSADVADSLARQRCEQTPLLSAMTWALRQEARALYFNPRLTALSLATALLDLFRLVEQLWPYGIFVPQYHEASLDATAARMADPAAQLAMAMLRCAGRAMVDVGVGACRESMVCGLRVAYDLLLQVSVLLDQPHSPWQEGMLKQLQQSPSLPQLMLALLAVETCRLHKQLGITDVDSCTLLLHPQPKPRKQQDTGLKGSLQQDQLCREPATSDAIQSAPKQQQQQQQQRQEDEEHEEIEGAGELHQIWHQVLGMARKNLARQDADQPAGEQQQRALSPLIHLWVSLGLPEGLLQLAAEAGVSAAPPMQQYVAVCRVSRVLLQGSPLLQVQHGFQAALDHTAASPIAQVPAEPQAVVSPISCQRSVMRSPLSPAGTPQPPRAALSEEHAVTVNSMKPSPFAGLTASNSSGRHPQLYKAAAGSLPKPLPLPPPWQHVTNSYSNRSARCSLAGALSGSLAPGVHSTEDPLIGPAASLSSLSPREYLQPGGAVSMTTETADQLVDSCRDFGLRGQEHLELLQLQRVVPVVLLSTAISVLQCNAGSRPVAGGQPIEDMFGAQETSMVSPHMAMVHAACTTAACVSRCWTVLQKVVLQQEELCDVLAECHPPSGVFAGLTTLNWQQYNVPTEVRLPVLLLLQQVVKLIWQLLPPSQQQQQPSNVHQHQLCNQLPQQQQQQHHQQQLWQQQNQKVGWKGAQGSSTAAPTASSGQLIDAQAGECIDSLLEVLTAVSKLPWEGQHSLPGITPTHGHTHHHTDGHTHTRNHTDVAGQGLQQDAFSDSSSVEASGDVDAELVAEAWRQECQPVAAAVEACLRLAGQVAAANDGIAGRQPMHMELQSGAQPCCGGVANGGTGRAQPTSILTDGLGAAAAAAVPTQAMLGSSQAAAAAEPTQAALGDTHAAVAAALPTQAALGPTQTAAAATGHAAMVNDAPGPQKHPSAVALGSCLAALCAPYGRPGPLVAAAASAGPWGPEQQQLYALLVSKLKVLLYNPASKKAALISMHPIEQTPIHVVQQLCARSSTTPDAFTATQHNWHQQASSTAAMDAAAVQPWLLLLSRLMLLRGKLLGQVLSNDDIISCKGAATSKLHTAYWHIRMAYQAGSLLSKHAMIPGHVFMSAPVTSGPHGTSACGQHQQQLQQQQQQQHQQRDLQSKLCLQLLPALKHAVQVLKAAMKLSRHHHDSSFATGFAAGFAAGYAAAQAAASGFQSDQPAPPGVGAFADPWGALQQQCIRVLPQMLESVGAALAWQLRHTGCSNPLCVNMSCGSELWLVQDTAADDPSLATASDGIDSIDCGSTDGSAEPGAHSSSVMNTCLPQSPQVWQQKCSTAALCCSCKAAVQSG